MTALISNIQRLSFHDGPGIRTMVFFMGCAVRCPWCANPENLKGEKQAFIVGLKCRAAERACPFASDCVALHPDRSLTEEAIDCCPIGAIREYGAEYDNDALLAILLDDRPFYGTQGGITWSGGEPLLHLSSVEPVMRSLKEQGVDQCAESCLFVPSDCVELALAYLDRMIIDVKLVDSKRCKDVINGDADAFLKNLDRVFESGLPVTLRFPVVPGITDDADNIGGIRELIDRYQPQNTEIFSVHNLGQSKYESLHLPFTAFQPAAPERLESVRGFLAAGGQDVSIIKL